MNRTTSGPDDALAAEPMTYSDVTPKNNAAELASHQPLVSSIDAGFIRSIEGIGWDGNLAAMRSADSAQNW